MKLKRGDRVILRVAKEPYYSGYAGNPKITIPVGAVGVVGAVDLPAVSSNRTFHCVDFVIDGRKWRCAVYPGEWRKEQDLRVAF